MVNNNVIAFIFARGGSKGVPNKNIRLLGDLPLIAHSIKTALSCGRIKKVIVSTDSLAIADVAKSYGAEVPFIRPAELAQDNSPEWLAWQHAVQMYEKLFPNEAMDIFVSLPCTSPFRSVDDVEEAIKLLETSECDMVVSSTPSQRSPWFNMIKFNEQGYVEVVNENQGKYNRRQDAPQTYDMSTLVYATRPNFIKTKSRVFEGKVKSIVVPIERAVDIDTEYDFKIAEFIYEQKLHLLKK